ncbi:ectoine/hydroxyectoine ABC transporter permease subunit EhuC [Streptosporangium sp. NBC_01756]|uniref:ectoine/hydroxyectoine ABC transporter permease subunit EhuC n=1 Tax=Streptosporangium sp. NBC_01756 TaxID=2975950 RepID=UPI002DDBF6E5|nr:ectoine/hydroxyectoine ABC transporter permease subunit EhuC [Streptosporangium sp. NBC_01756]WSC87726.1 ectoine/hydroxyectoine ABC transporter permease subunit EhuC [Streptosporangium sp. NBC_01756]
MMIPYAAAPALGTVTEIWPYLMDGARVTVLVALGATPVALALAFVVGLLSRSRHVWIRGVVRVYLELFRGTSVIVQMYWIFFAMPALTGYRLDPILAGIVAVGLHMGAYGSEVVRGAIAAVPRTQWEAAVALNFSPFQCMVRVILPQAWVGMVPALNNNWIELLKVTSLVSVISVADLIAESNTLRNSGYSPLIVMTMVMVVYLVLALAITTIMRFLERRAARRVGRDVAPVFRTRRGDGSVKTAPSAGGLS